MAVKLQIPNAREARPPSLKTGLSADCLVLEIGISLEPGDGDLGFPPNAMTLGSGPPRGKKLRSSRAVVPSGSCSRNRNMPMVPCHSHAGNCGENARRSLLRD